MDCFLHQRKNSVDEEYLPKNQLPHQYICCQAYVQVLFEIQGKWNPEMTGELILYVVKNSANENEQMYLSFFSGPRQRFQIKVSEIEKLQKSHPNLIVIIHGKTILGFTFAIEHTNRVDVFVQFLKPKLPATILAAKIKRAADNISSEVKKAATKVQNTFNIEHFKKHHNLSDGSYNQMAVSITTRHHRRLSDSSINTTLDPQITGKTSLPHPSALRKNNTKFDQKPESDSIILKAQNFKRSRSLRIHQHHENKEDEEVSQSKTNVKNLIDLWNSKTTK